MAAMPRLLDKQLVQAFAVGDDGQPVYRWTRLGYVVAKGMSMSLPTVVWNRPPVDVSGGATGESEKRGNT
jgi:hypothetical protein